ncbi:hypothetical protein, partial [Citrobacter freundii]|uniref:hypothetical protein n=1 Tax=Citrobacter freundii TaxID=546 RepID=UPI001952D969
LEAYPAIQRWYAAVRQRPAVQRGLAVLGELLQRNRAPPTGSAWSNLFGDRQFADKPVAGDGEATR